MMVISGDPEVLSDSIRWGFNDTILPIVPAFENANMLKSLDIDTYINPTGDDNKNVEFNWHQWGVYISDFQKNFKLSSFFNLLSYDDYGDGLPIVGTVEAYDYPIMATQYHPEKNLFDYLNTKIPHTRKAQQFTEDLAFNFVEACRKNKHNIGLHSHQVAKHINNYRRHFGLFEHDGDNVYIDYYVFEDELIE